MRVLVYGVTQYTGENVEIEGDNYRVITVEPAPEVGFDGLNQWEGPGGVYSRRASWVTLEPLSADESQAWNGEIEWAFQDRAAKAKRPWWKF